MTEVKDNKITEACTILFGETFAVEQNTIDYLPLSGIKTAFREKVKDCHPDTAESDNYNSAENFIKLKNAYDFLISVKSSNNEFIKSQSGTTKAAVIPQRKLKLGEYLYYTGKISWKTLDAAITWQKNNKKKNKSSLLGSYFIKYRILSSAELGFSLFKMNVHNSNN